MCKVCAGGEQSNNSVGAQRNSVTVVDVHSDGKFPICEPYYLSLSLLCNFYYN